jgi:hypothetical protein
VAIRRTSRTKSAEKNLERVYLHNRSLSQMHKQISLLTMQQQYRSISLSRWRAFKIERLQEKVTSTYILQQADIGQLYTNAKLVPGIARKNSPEKEPSESGDESPVAYETDIQQPSDEDNIEVLPSDDEDEPADQTPELQVRNIERMANQVNIKMLPSEEVIVPLSESEDDDIVYPESVDDKQAYQLVAQYRRMNDESLDFQENPLKVGANEIETLILGLNASALIWNCKLIFSKESASLDYSCYRAAAGVADIGSFHLLAAGGLATAQFQIKLNRHFDDVCRSDESIKGFVHGFCHATNRVLGSRNHETRVFSIRRKTRKSRYSWLDFGLTTDDLTRTTELANEMQVI